jgi:hypothetical protein
VIEDTESLSRKIGEAARLAGVRVVLQSSWATMKGGGDHVFLVRAGGPAMEQGLLLELLGLGCRVHPC